MAKSTKPVKAAVIGCGNISPSHFKAYQSCGIELVAVSDVDAGKAEVRKAEFGTDDTEIFTDYKELLKRRDIELVTVATPVSFHAPITIDALKAGKHVACEKPSTLSIKENKAIIAAWKKSKKKVVFFSARQRWGASSLARDYINNGDLGEIYRVNVTYYRRRGRPGIDVLKDAPWFTERQYAGGGVIMDMGQYFMDNVFHLCGWPTITAVSATTFRGHVVEAMSKGQVFDVEEHCTILARTNTTCSYTFDMAWFSYHKPKREITILGTRGGIVMSDQEPFVYMTERGGPWNEHYTTSPWKDMTNHNDHIYLDLIQAIRGKDPGIGTNPEQALMLTQVTQAALQSADTDKEVKISQLKGS